jgi:glycosyltransferase involved in cell wall biosynthesis
LEKILFLSHYFPPEVNAPANRTYEHCKIWAKEKNVSVTVITNFPNHPDGKIFLGYKNKFIHKEKKDGIDVIRLLTFITANEGFLLRALNYVWYMVVTILYVTLSGVKFDVVIATTPQFFCGLAGKYISRIKRKPFILELRDLWPESIVAVGAISNKKIIGFLERMEMNLYKASGKIVSLTQSFKNTLVAKGIPQDKIDIVYNGVIIDKFKSPFEITNNELSEYLSSGFLVGYIGTIGMAHSIITLVEAAEKLKESDIKFVIVGSGAERAKIENEILKRDLKNIRLFPLQPNEEIPSIVKKLNVFCVHLKKNNLFKTVIPSKIFEGMICAKPILIGVEGESKDIVENAECGLSFEPESAKDLADKILMLKNDSHLQKKLGENGYKYVTENFDRTKIALSYLSLIKSMILI